MAETQILSPNFGRLLVSNYFDESLCVLPKDLEVFSLFPDLDLCHTPCMGLKNRENGGHGKKISTFDVKKWGW